MAIVTQSAGLVRQKAFHGIGGARSSVPNSQCLFWALKALFLHLSSNKGNPDLKLFNIDGGYSSSDGGNNASQVAVDGPCTIYAIYLKKTGSTATSFKVSNHASTASTDGTQSLGYILVTAGEDNLFLFPDGHAMATGVTITENTTATGSTLTLAANRIDGFIIAGA